MSREPLLELKDVHAGYGLIEVLKGISLTVYPGEIVTLIGANGAGKSTTLNTICGLLPVRRGTIALSGEATSGWPPPAVVARGVVQVPEGRKLFANMTVRENLELGAYRRRDRGGVRRDLDRVVALFPILAERRNQLAGSLSGGEQQMCAIGRALMAEPRVLLLDEPSLGLAPMLCEHIFRIIRQLNGDGTTIFLVEQNALAALRLAHRGYVIETGTITLEGSGRDLLENPSVKSAYLGP